MSELKTVDDVTLVNALEVLQAERKIRKLRIAEQEALTAKAVTEKSTQDAIAQDLEERTAAERSLEKARLAQQQALAEKAQIELATQKIVLELTEEHQRTVKLPELKLGGN